MVMLCYTNSNVARADSENMLAGQPFMETDMLEITVDIVAEYHHADTEQHINTDEVDAHAEIEDEHHVESDDGTEVDAECHVEMEDVTEVDTTEDYVDARDQIEGEMFGVADHQLSIDENCGEVGEQTNYEQDSE